MRTLGSDEHGERARLLAIEIAGCIARHCPSPRAGDYGGMAVTAVGALATRGGRGDVEGLALAGQYVEELLSISSVCPNRRLCGIHPVAEELSGLLLTLQ